MLNNRSVADVRKEVSGTRVEVALMLLMAQNHQDMLKAVQRGVDYACSELKQQKQSKQKHSEDQLNIDITSMLRMAGFQATHETMVGGHTDICVSGKNDFLWIAEGKKHNAYDWLDKGFQQLSTRYSTGEPGQDNGEVLIYCFVSDATTRLNIWRQRLIEKNSHVTAVDSPCGSPLKFCSSHEHASSGQPFYVRHNIVSLYWNPQDG